MPYIPQDRRTLLPRRFFDDLPDEPVAGDLNYLFSIIAKEYLERRGLRYAHLNDVMGALTGAQLETYRRIAGAYEDTAIERNGDMWDEVGRVFPSKYDGARVSNRETGHLI